MDGLYIETGPRTMIYPERYDMMIYETEIFQWSVVINVTVHIAIFHLTFLIME